MKTIRKLEDLAIFGAPPMFAEPLHVGRPNVGDRDAFLRRVGEMLDRRWFTNFGPLVQEFERKLEAYLGVRHVVTVCNATVGLEIAIRALGLRGEVVVPSFTFIATAHALQWQEIVPVFADIDPATHNLDPAAVERAITPRTTGIIGVHVWGRPCDVEGLQAVADRHGLALMFDAAHAFGCSHKGRMIGNFGRCEVFSFHATKFFNTFEGGAIATNDDDLASRIRLMTNFGFSGYDNVIHLGTNGKMTEVCAAMGLTGLENLGVFVERNMTNHSLYRRSLHGIPGLHFAAYDAAERHNHQYVVIEVDSEQFGVVRDALLRVLHAEGLLARRYFFPGCHRMAPYRTLSPEAGGFLPATERLTDKVLVLPTGMAVDREKIQGIANAMRIVQRNADCIRDRLAVTPN